MIWLALAIPFVGAAIVYAAFRRRIAWWEVLLPVALSAVVIAIVKYTAETTITRDTEYWGTWAVSAQYFEPWDEEVSCRHSYSCNCYTSCTGSGNSRSCTEHCSTCYMHAYDVDYHPASWELNGADGSTFPLSQNDFEWFARQWNSREFVELNRRVHSIDGDKYVARWNGADATLEPITTTHTYENRVAASQSVFNFRDVDPKDKAALGLYDYPPIRGWLVNPLLGYNGADAEAASQALSLINAKLGARKQVRVWVLVFTDKPITAAAEQENLWKGGNKNEIVVNVGVDRTGAVQWAQVFSWSERDDLKVAIRDYVIGQKRFDPLALAKWMYPEVQRRYVRKEFADFSYLSVPTPRWALILTYVLTILATAGKLWWAATNDFDADGPRRRQRIPRDPFGRRYW